MDKQQQRRHFSGTDKVAILKRHLVEKVPISDLCDEHKIQPSQFYTWLREFFENAHVAFDKGRKPRAAKAAEDTKDRKIQQLEAKLVRKNEVLSELMEEHTLLKKELGEP